jgi:surface antigen
MFKQLNLGNVYQGWYLVIDSHIERYTICTDFPGQLVTLKSQTLAPTRGHRTLKGWGQLGIISAAMLIGLSGVSLPKAYAADSSWSNIETAKKAIVNVAPDLLANKVTDVSALSNATENFIQKPLVAETQITPDPPKRKVVVKATSTAKVVKAAVNVVDEQTSAHRFPYGYCTYYVSQHRFVPWSGNAIAWLSGAQSYGYATGKTPQAGAILVTTEGGWTGHVALVNSVNDDGSFTVSEMNYKGFGVTSSRTVPANYGRILGFIY